MSKKKNTRDLLIESASKFLADTTPPAHKDERDRKEEPKTNPQKEINKGICEALLRICGRNSVPVP